MSEELQNHKRVVELSECTGLFIDAILSAVELVRDSLVAEKTYSDDIIASGMMSGVINAGMNIEQQIREHGGLILGARIVPGEEIDRSKEILNLENKFKQD